MTPYPSLLIPWLATCQPERAKCARSPSELRQRAINACQHFLLYEDVPGALRVLSERHIRIGLISNSHRCLESFQSHFELEGLIDVAISSSQHGYMKPHPSIFEAALKLAGVEASDAVMVGDSLSQDIEGARRVGMRGILVRRSEAISAPGKEGDVPVVRSLGELPDLS